MFGASQPCRQRLVYRSQLEESSATEADDKSFAHVETKADIVTYLSVASAWQIDIIPYTWHPNLGNIGQGQTGGIQQSIANLQTSFAFQTFDRLKPEIAFEEAISEIQVWGGSQIRGHPNIISLEGICWNVLAPGDVLPVLVFEKTNLGSLSSFMQKNNEGSSIETQLRIAIGIIRAMSILHARGWSRAELRRTYRADPAQIFSTATSSLRTYSSSKPKMRISQPKLPTSVLLSPRRMAVPSDPSQANPDGGIPIGITDHNETSIERKEPICTPWDCYCCGFSPTTKRAPWMLIYRLKEINNQKSCFY
jgi:hypothetical protein